MAFTTEMPTTAIAVEWSCGKGLREERAFTRFPSVVPSNLFSPSSPSPPSLHPTPLLHPHVYFLVLDMYRRMFFLLWTCHDLRLDRDCGRQILST